ncbi:MAG: LytTR family DNA-binding domain-containing protein [Bacteroidota bacterium]
MKYKCIIVEDNILERDALAIKIKKIDSLTLRAVLSDGLEAITTLKNEEIDIVFSDIDMPDLSGIELLKSLKHPPVFIFISSHPEHAAESFELDVIDYIVKPVKMERLIKATDKAVEYILAKKKLQAEPTAKITPLSVAAHELVKTIDAQAYFFIKEKHAYIKLNMGDVLYIESMGDFSKVITTQQKVHFVLISLKNLEKQLPSHVFLRVHKQYIINILHIQNISISDIKLNSNDIIPISVAYKQALHDNVINKKSLTRFGVE